MINCIAVDDEPLALELLEDNISKLPYLKLVGSFDNGIEAMKAVQEQKIDLIFLDIQMPGLTGLQLIQSLTVKPMIILITAYEKYALEGFNLEVTDYLVKPVSLERFIKACNKAKELFDLRNQPTSAKQSPGYFFVNVEYSMVKVAMDDIVFIEGLKDYIKIHLHSSSKAIVTRMAMKTIEEQLPSGKFIRIHKSYIVSVAFITAVKKTSVFIGNNELPVSDNYKESVLAITGRL
ncbi:MAG TPA: response regulator transcription factor [Ferruginibacter sp.]|nr:response regulator transcription factor [Ferruginibacter sp.]HPH92289.1 response regulator transcription factor [Ferruginibacter sp.]